MKKLILIASVLVFAGAVKTDAQAVVRVRPCRRTIVARPRPIVVVPARRVIVRPRILRPAVVVVR